MKHKERNKRKTRQSEESSIRKLANEASSPILFNYMKKDSEIKSN